MKGISIILVLWGHCIQYLSVESFDFFDDSAFKIIYSFHMPLFMLLSGYANYWGHDRELKIILNKRVIGIGIPLFIWGFLDYLLIIIQGKSPNLVDWIHSIIGIWFLWAVLCSSVYVSIVCKFPIRKDIKYLILFLSTILFVKIPNGTMVAYVYPYFVVGYALNEFDLLKNKSFNKIVQPLCALLWIALIPVYQKKDYIYISGLTIWIKEYGLKEQLVIDMYRYVIGLSGCLAVLMLLRLIYSFMDEHKILTDTIELCGRHTLEIYLMQRIVLEKVIALVYKKTVMHTGVNLLMNNRFVFDLIVTPVIAVLITIMLVKIAKMLSRNPFVKIYVFGKT